MKQVLLVDDDLSVRQMIALALAAVPVEVIESALAREAMGVLEHHRPDLILLDYRLPDINGIDFLHMVTAKGLDIPAILVSASWEWESKPLPSAVVAIIPKPFRIKALQDTVRQHTMTSTVPLSAL